MAAPNSSASATSATSAVFAAPSEDMRRFMGAINLPMVAWDTQCRLAYCNAAYEAMRGVPAAEMLGCTLLDLFGEEAWRLGEPHLRRALGGRSEERRVGKEC